MEDIVISNLTSKIIKNNNNNKLQPRIKSEKLMFYRRSEKDRHIFNKNINATKILNFLVFIEFKYISGQS